jgi:hypothetical protein
VGGTRRKRLRQRKKELQKRQHPQRPEHKGRDKHTMHQFDAKHLEDLFSLFRAYIERENNLINNRMTWLMTVQSFVIATYGFSYQRKFEVLGNLYINDNREALLKLPELTWLLIKYDYFLILLAAVGLVTSGVAFMSIRAAFKAIRSIVDKWNTDFAHEEATHLPGIAGGGDDVANRHGKIFALALPGFFVGFWALVMLLTLPHIQLGINHF